MMDGRVSGACARDMAAPWASAVLMSEGDVPMVVGRTCVVAWRSVVGWFGHWGSLVGWRARRVVAAAVACVSGGVMVWLPSEAKRRGEE